MPAEQVIRRKASKLPVGLKLRHTLRGHTSWIGRIAWAPDGRWLASGSDDTNVNIWSAESWTLARQLRGHEDSVFRVAWSPDGKMLASSSDDETIIIWNVEDGQLLRTLRGHTSGVVTVVWSPDGHLLLSGAGRQNYSFMGSQHWQIARGS